MAIVFIEEANGPIRVCSKQATADALGIASADVDLSNLTHPTEHYTLVGGSLVELTDLIDAAAVEREQEWVKEELVHSDIVINKMADGHSRTSGNIATWRSYRNDLRDYIQGGVIFTDKPVRPS